MYICGPPGVGKTVTLNSVLSSPAFAGKARVLFNNAMNYRDMKEFLERLDQKLCMESKTKYCPSISVEILAPSIQVCLKKLDTYTYVLPAFTLLV